MKRIIRTTLFVVLLAGCGDDQDPDGAAELFQRIQDADYRSFARAPGYPGREPSAAAHGNEVEIFINDVVVDALTQGDLTEWPRGALIVKDGYDDGEHSLIAAMEKQDGGWFWAEWTDLTGESAKYSGRPEICTDCHSSGADFVRAFGFP